jgi:gamma-glutamyltranspeptidase/glutathione hydrolase
LSDPDFADVPLAALLSQEYADIRFKEIRPDQTWPELMRDTPSGDPFEFGETDTPRVEQKPHDDGSTSHISVVDAAGNAVSLTQTLNLFWGAGVVVEGFVLNNGMTAFGQTNPYNTIKPWRRPRSTISPTIILKDGRPFLVIGSPGSGRIISAIVETVCNIVDFGMSPEEANAAPRFAALPTAANVLVETRFPEDLIDRLQKAGHQFERLGEMDLFFGGVQMILIDRNTGTLYGSSDPRRSGVALAY